MPRVRALTEAERDKERDLAIRQSIRHRKDDAGMTVEEVAKKAGLSCTAIYTYMKSPSKMTIQTYRNVCRALGIEVRV